MPDPTSENAAVPLEGVAAVGVILRLNGSLVAAGEDHTPDPGMLRRAVGRALAEFAAHPANEWPEALRESLGPSLELELDLCGDPAPLPGSTFAAAAAQVDPGRDALAVRRGNEWHLAYPGRLLAANLAAGSEQTLRRLARDAGLPAGEIRALAAIDSVGLYRLPTLRLRQESPGAAPTVLERLAPVVSIEAIDAALVEAMADALLARIAGSITPRQREDGDEPAAMPAALGLQGDYDPAADRHRPIAAPPFEQALAALALERLATVSPPHRAEALRLARRLAESLAETDPLEDPADASPEALAALAILFANDPALAGGDAALEELASRSRDAVERELGDEAVFAARSGGRQALLAAAAAAIARDDRSRERAGHRLQDAWDACDPAMRVGLLPWFASARRTLAGGLDAASLRTLRESLLARQIEAGDEAAPDLEGGFDLQGGLRPLADARSLVPAVGLAILLGDDAVTPLDGSPEARRSLGSAAASHRAAVRFLRQLSEPVTGRGARGEGGVRAAPWDARQPVLAQAMALWLLAESIAAGVP